MSFKKMKRKIIKIIIKKAVSNITNFIPTTTTKPKVRNLKYITFKEIMLEIRHGPIINNMLTLITIIVSMPIKPSIAKIDIRINSITIRSIISKILLLEILVINNRIISIPNHIISYSMVTFR